MLQVVRLILAASCSATAVLQPFPPSVQLRRAGNRDSQQTRDQVARSAESLCKKGAIRVAARDCLVGWAFGTLPKAARLATYSFLGNMVGTWAMRWTDAQTQGSN